MAGSLPSPISGSCLNRISGVGSNVSLNHGGHECWSIAGVRRASEQAANLGLYYQEDTSASGRGRVKSFF
jgi:hypothetical protein